MRYIIAYRLKRKNARRRMYAKLEAVDLIDAQEQFESYIQYRKTECDTSKQVWELLTGDWKHICFWCEECNRITHNVECSNCKHFEEMKGMGKKNEGLS